MDISYVKGILEQIFSKSGYKIGNFTLSCPNVLSAVIKKDDSGLTFDFKDRLPSVRTKKLFLPITAQVEGIFFGIDGGSIKLKYFPDFNFKYDFGFEGNFGSSIAIEHFSNVEKSILKQYPDKERRKIAQLALQYTNEWVTIASQSGIDFATCSKSNKKVLIKNCEQFVHENILKSKEIEAKSPVLGFILVYLVLPAIISWVVKKLLDKFFN